MNRLAVAVDGIDGSGKSTFAGRLFAGVESAGAQAALVRVDDFRRTLDWNGADEATLYYEQYYALDRLGAVVQAFASGATMLELPGFDGIAGQPLPARQVSLKPAAVLILEGVFIRRIPFGTAPVDHIYLHTPAAVARRQLVARDTARGRATVEIERRLDRRYVPGQARYHAECDPQQRADLIVDNSDPTAPLLRSGSMTALPPLLASVLTKLLSRGPQAGDR